MIKQKAAPCLIILSMMILVLSGQVLAEERSIFVGDLIKIKVSTQKLTQDEMREKFKEFEIVDMQNDADGYIITLRSFETGEKTVQLGDKELIITVKSTLDELEREEIFEGDLSPEKAKFSITWQYVFYILLIIFLLTGGINLTNLIKKRKIASLSPYAHFINNINKVPLYSDDYFVSLTLYFKQYLESKYSVNIKGKTSTEIIRDISPLYDLQPQLPAIQSWLKESDYYKFAGITASKENKQKSFRELIQLAGKIEELKEVDV